MRRLERRLRLATGLIVAWFVVGHFLNHSLGVVSIDAMDRVRSVLAAWWRSPPGTVLLYGSLLTHFALALVSLYRRTTLRMPVWEAAQLVLGLAVPPLLVPAMALAGFAAAGNEIWPAIEGAGGMRVYYPEIARMSAADRARLVAWREGLEFMFWGLLAATLLARWLRTRLGGTYQLRHASGRVITAPIGRSILEAVRDAGLPHASVCGGRARCTT